MPQFREILNQCPLYELKACARFCGLPDGGMKTAVISALIRGHRTEVILDGLGGEQLRRICRIHGLPASGSKDMLIDRLFEIISPLRSTGVGKTSKKKCIMCEHLYDQKALHRHHFVPLSRSEFEAGTVLLCGTCHSIFHRCQSEAEKKEGHRLSEEEIIRLFSKTKKERRAGGKNQPSGRLLVRRRA